MNMHEKILDNLQELVYIADMETYELLYYNRALAEEFHTPRDCMANVTRSCRDGGIPVLFVPTASFPRTAAMYGSSTTSLSDAIFC
mgnify:FL=1